MACHSRNFVHRHSSRRNISAEIVYIMYVTPGRGLRRLASGPILLFTTPLLGANTSRPAIPLLFARSPHASIRRAQLQPQPATHTHTPLLLLHLRSQPPAVQWHFPPSVSTTSWTNALPSFGELPAQATTNYKEAFALFDKRGNGRVPANSLGDLLRACGQNPTNAEVDDLVAGAKVADFDFESFLKILNRPNGFREPGEPEEFVRGFQVFDKDMTGFIGVGELRYGTWFLRVVRTSKGVGGVNVVDRGEVGG